MSAMVVADTDPAHVNAANLLRQRGADVARVIRIDPDLISYLDSAGRTMSAWLRNVGAALRVAVEVGWPAEPSANSLRILDRAIGGDAEAETAAQIKAA